MKKSKEEPSLPIYEAVALEKTSQGWVLIKFKIQGDKVIDMRATIPDIKRVAIEYFKVYVAKHIFPKE